MKYLAITIGPIYRTLTDVRRVRHLWGGSYLFSYLMKQIILETDRLAAPKKDALFERLLPKYDASKQFFAGVGRFPDRLFLRVLPSKEGQAHSALLSCLKNAVDKVCSINPSNGAQHHQQLNLDRYLQTFSLEMDIPAGENYVMPLNQALDCLEWQHKAGEVDYLNLTEYLDVALRSKFYQDAFDDHSIRFETLAEIGANDLLQNIDKGELDYFQFIKIYRDTIGTSEEPDFFKWLSEKDQSDKSHWRQYHKYFAIVHADGDNIGKALETFGHDDNKVRIFSERLFDFAGLTAIKIAAHGGLPVYAGGDDLLFFAPVMSQNDDHKISVFQICSELSSLFESSVVDPINFWGNTKPTLSFGINFSYYKYPMAEALTSSRLALNTAKSTVAKNCTSFYVQKHSGSNFKGILPNDMLQDEGLVIKMLSLYGTQQESVLNSVSFALESNQALLEEILTHNPAQLTCFFNNHFNEAIHKQEPFKSFLKNTRELMQALGQRSPIESVQNTVALLFFIQFINAKFREDA